MPTTKTYRVPAQNVDKLKEHVEKLNKKVAKLAKKGYEVSPIEISVGQPEVIHKTKKLATGGDYNYDEIFFPVTISGQTVKAGGWEFIATLQHEEGGTIVRAVPGMTQEGELAPYRECKPACDHCGFNRRRNDTFILRKSVEVVNG